MHVFWMKFCTEYECTDETSFKINHWAKRGGILLCGGKKMSIHYSIFRMIILLCLFWLWKSHLFLYLSLISHLKSYILPQPFQFFRSPTCGGVVTLKTGRREVPDSKPGHACRPSRSEFSVVFSETRVNTGKDSLEIPPRRAFHL